VVAGVRGAAKDSRVFRLRYARRSLHRQNPKKGGVRPRFGGTTNGGFFRKGDRVEAEKAGKTYRSV